MKTVVVQDYVRFSFVVVLRTILYISKQKVLLEENDKCFMCLLCFVDNFYRELRVVLCYNFLLGKSMTFSMLRRLYCKPFYTISRQYGYKYMPSLVVYVVFSLGNFFVDCDNLNVPKVFIPNIDVMNLLLTLWRHMGGCSKCNRAPICTHIHEKGCI